MLEFFEALVAANVPELSQKKLLDMMVGPVMGAQGASIHKQGRASIAKCVAALVVPHRNSSSSISTADAVACINTFSGQIKSGNAPPHQQTFALLAIGEIGKHV
jgi:hypothetical protein